MFSKHVPTESASHCEDINACTETLFKSAYFIAKIPWARFEDFVKQPLFLFTGGETREARYSLHNARLSLLVSGIPDTWSGIRLVGTLLIASRSLARSSRYLSKGHERQARGVFSPGPAMYVGHDEILPLVPRPPPPASAPGSSRCRPDPPSSRTAGTGEGMVSDVNKRFLRRPRAETADSRVGVGTRRR